jgi:hypothetical protein
VHITPFTSVTSRHNVTRGINVFYFEGVIKRLYEIRLRELVYGQLCIRQVREETMYVQRNTEARSHNHYCRGKETSTVLHILNVCVCVCVCECCVCECVCVCV